MCNMAIAHLNLPFGQTKVISLSNTEHYLVIIRLTGVIKAFNGTCVRLTSITFPVIWSIVLISVTREWRYFLIKLIT